MLLTSRCVPGTVRQPFLLLLVVEVVPRQGVWTWRVSYCVDQGVLYLGLADPICFPLFPSRCADVTMSQVSGVRHDCSVCVRGVEGPAQSREQGPLQSLHVVSGEENV